MDKRQNTFTITDENGDVIGSGHNVVLETGRRFNGMMASGIPTTFESTENTLGTQIVVDPRNCDSQAITIAGFGCIGGILSSTVPNPKTAYTADYKPLSDSEIANLIVLRDDHAWDGRIKEHALFDGTNPVRDIDNSGVEFFIHELVLGNDEMDNKYTVAITTFAKVVVGGEDVFIPYSIFSFAPVVNDSEEFSKTWGYQVYL